MNLRIILPCLLIALFLGACSGKKDFTGTWKSKEGSVLTLNADYTARLSQEGMEGGSAGKYTVSGDTVSIVENPVNAGEETTFNEFVFVFENDELGLRKLVLHRGNDVGTQTVEELSRMTGRPASQYALHRVPAEAK